MLCVFKTRTPPGFDREPGFTNPYNNSTCFILAPRQFAVHYADVNTLHSKHLKLESHKFKKIKKLLIFYRICKVLKIRILDLRAERRGSDLIPVSRQ